MSVLQSQLAGTLIRQLSALRGYPAHKEGESRMADLLMEVSVSVEHARAIVREFEDQFPTPHEFRDTAFNLRGRFLPSQPSQEEQWEAEYGPPRKEWYQNKDGDAIGSSTEPDWIGIRHHGIRDALYYVANPKESDKQGRIFWADYLHWLEKRHPAEVAAIRAGKVPPREKESRPTPRADPPVILPALEAPAEIEAGEETALWGGE